MQYTVVADNVLASCLSHALSTQREEVIGFCLGTSYNGITYVLDTCVFPRSDRKSDRVEVGMKEQIMAMELASDVSKRTGIETKIVGWYHSHPAITCPPSAVDIRTQHSLQNDHFVGLIYSVFNESANTVPWSPGKLFTGRVQCHCFRSTSNSSHESVPFVVKTRADLEQDLPRLAPAVPVFKGVWNILKLLYSEEWQLYEEHKEAAPVHSSGLLIQAFCQIDACIQEPMSETLECDRECLSFAEESLDDELREAEAQLQRQEKNLHALTELARLRNEIDGHAFQ